MTMYACQSFGCSVLCYDLTMEYIDVVDEETGAPTGQTASIDDIHIKGHWHRTVNIWVFDDQERVLVQRRDKSVLTYPEYLLESAGGHMKAGQTSVEAAIEEISEELGVLLKEQDLIFVGSCKEQDAILGQIFPGVWYRNNEFVDIYLHQTRKPLEEYISPDKDVDSFLIERYDTILPKMIRGDVKAVPHLEGYRLALEALRALFGQRD